MKTRYENKVFETEEARFYKSVSFKGTKFCINDFFKVCHHPKNKTLIIARIVSLFQSKYEPCVPIAELRFFSLLDNYERKSIQLSNNVLVECYETQEYNVQMLTNEKVTVVSCFEEFQQNKHESNIFFIKFSEINGALVPYKSPKFDFQYSERLQVCTTLAKEYLFYNNRLQTLDSNKMYFVEDLFNFSHNFFFKTIPKKLLQREEEAKRIQTYIEFQLINANKGVAHRRKFKRLTRNNRGALLSSAMSVCADYPGVFTIVGMPGTGKTLTVVTVLHRLKTKANNNMFPNFKVVFINCFKHKTSANVYREIYHKLSGTKYNDDMTKSSRKIREACENIIFNSSNSKKYVIVVDEIDEVFKTRDKEVVQLFLWPYMINTLEGNNSLVILAISNLFDLFEQQTFPNSLALKRLRLSFDPYSIEDTKEITVEKLKTIGWPDLFTKEAISYCATACAKILGDYRSASQIWHYALKLAKQQRMADQTTTIPMHDFFVDIELAKQAVKEVQRVDQVFETLLFQTGRLGIFILAMLSQICIENETSIVAQEDLCNKVMCTLRVLNIHKINHSLLLVQDFQEDLNRILHKIEKTEEIILIKDQMLFSFYSIKAIKIENPSKLEQLFKINNVNITLAEFGEKYEAVLGALI